MVAKEIASDDEGVQALANAIDLEMGLRPLRLKLADYVMALLNRAPDSKLPPGPWLLSPAIFIPSSRAFMTSCRLSTSALRKPSWIRLP